MLRVVTKTVITNYLLLFLTDLLVEQNVLVVIVLLASLFTALTCL